MRSFSFKSDYDENQNIERIITERNRKLAKQQIIFAILLFLIVALLLWYMFRRVIYTEFDGYIQTEYKDYRAIEDIYLFDQYTQVGDIVLPGDTLYSFVFVNLFGIGNMESEPNVIVNDRNMRLQLNMAYADANVLRVRIRELENQIATEDNNIRFGLTDNSHKMDLQRQLAEAREQLNATLRKAYMYNNMHRETSSTAHRFGQYSMEFANEQLGLDHSLKQLYDRNSSAIRYSIAQDTAIVTKLWAPPFSRVFKQEHILQLENVSLEDSNMQIVAYVPTQAMGRINNNTRAEIIVNDDLSFTATVLLLGARTEDLPEDLRNSLSHTYTTVMVVFKPDPGQVLPLWAVVDRVPVRVRINNFHNGHRDDGSDYWYIDENGLTDESKFHLNLLRRYRRNGPHRYDPTNWRDSVSAESLRKTAANDEAAKETKARQEEEQKPAENAQPSKGGQKFINHKIRRGETMYSISKKYKVPLQSIIDCNSEADSQHLEIGKTLRVPVKDDTAK